MLAATVLLAATLTCPMERVATVDPALVRSVFDAHVAALLYETILTVDYAARPYRVAPGLSDLPEVSADGRTYRFRLRPGAKVTAADAVRSLRRLADADLASPNAWMLKDVASVEAEGKDVFVIRLERPRHILPWLMAMPNAAVSLPDGSGTGPYVLSEWTKNHSMTFTRRTPVPADAFDTVRYLVVDDASTQWLMFLRGEIDLLTAISREHWDAAVRDGRLDPHIAALGITLKSVPRLDTFYLGINMRDPVLGRNRRLRQALNAAFDRGAWERFYAGTVIGADGPLPPGVDGRLDTPFEYRFDLEKAKRLLAEAGYPGGIDPKTGRRLELELAIGRASQDSRESGELTAAFFERVGIRLNLRYYTWEAFLRAVNDGRTQLSRIAWVGDYPDAENFLQLFHSKNVSPGPNHSSYASAEFDAEYERAMAALSAEERNRRWRRCQEIVREDCPWVFMHFAVGNMLVGPRVGGFIPSAFPYGNEIHYRRRQLNRVLTGPDL